MHCLEVTSSLQSVAVAMSCTTKTVHSRLIYCIYMNMYVVHMFACTVYVWVCVH